MDDSRARKTSGGALLPKYRHLSPGARDARNLAGLTALLLAFYTVEMNNSGLPDADEATFEDTFSAAGKEVAATCGAENGAVCPGNLSGSDAVIAGTVGAFPHLGLVTITRGAPTAAMAFGAMLLIARTAAHGVRRRRSPADA